MLRLYATLLAFFLAASAAAPRPSAAPLVLRSCELEGVAARCGTYEVFEDRTARRGRKIALRVVVVPARSKTPLDDPLVLFAGGPGSGATTFISDIETAFADIHRERDILMVDPASAPRHAERAGRYLTNSRHVVLPYAGHGPGGIVGGMECFDRLSTEFVLRGTVEDLDTSCVEELRRPPFVLDLDGPS